MIFNEVNCLFSKLQITGTAWFILTEFDYENHQRNYYLGSDNYGLIWFMYGVGFVDSDMDANDFPTIEYIRKFICNTLMEYPDLDFEGR